MFVIFEPLCVGPEHVEFNAALIATVHAAFPGERLLFLAEARHRALVRARLDAAAAASAGGAPPPGVLRSASVRPLPRMGRGLARYLGERAVLSRVVQLAARARARGLILSSATPEGILALARALGHARRREPPPPSVQVVLHAVLESLLHRPPRHPVRRLFGLRRVLRASARPGLGFLLLSPTFEARLVPELPWLAPALASMEHPYFFDQPIAPRPPGAPPAFGTLGAARAAKGSGAWGPLARAVVDAAGAGAASFVHVGMVFERELLDMGPAVRVATGPDGGWIGRADYERELERLDYAVFLYPRESYTLTASGALMDALAFGKPVIALGNPYFEHCFGLLGDIGYLCASLDEMRDLMIELARHPPRDRYLAQQARIAASRRLLEPEAVARTFAANWKQAFG